MTGVCSTHMEEIIKYSNLNNKPAFLCGTIFDSVAVIHNWS